MDLEAMKPIGIIRKLGREGRVCIPAEIRELMNVEENDLVEQIPYKTKEGEYVLLIRKWK